MKNNLKYPNVEAAKSIFKKLNIDVSDRDMYCQDFQYTTCRYDELAQYFYLYKQSDTTAEEKRVLGCYLLDCLNGYVEPPDKVHPLQNEVFKLLYSDIEIHKTELEYWSDTQDRDEFERWPICKYLLQWQNK